MSSTSTQAQAALDANAAAQQRDQLLAAARNPRTTPFDYIVVGSGAGGGALAARLAESEQDIRVLVLEAGDDPAHPEGTTGAREVYEVPGYHGVATEDPKMCWSFSVRHYANHGRQQNDSKYTPAEDPSTQGGSGQGGILYPRSSGIGGCTGHFAMIVVKPNDIDWDQIADVTGDESWAAARMQGYFGRIEDCLYYKSYQGFLRKVWWFYTLLMRVVGFINPRWQLDVGGHGFSGWQKTSFIDPGLVRRIAKGDRTFLRLLFDVFLYLWTRKGQLRALLGAFGRLQIVQFLDPNFGTQRGGHSGRTAFIPIATDGKSRFGLRERLLSVAERLPERLVLLQGVLATRLIFRGESGRPPQVVGVEVERGLHLYEASPLHEDAPADPPRLQFFARREVIVAAGAFNTPQLLMLSGIGDEGHLRDRRIKGPRDADGIAVSDIVNLPGVGRNLQDRYEVSVVGEMKSDFSTLAGISFRPGDGQDPARDQWLRDGQGLYSTNGGAVALFYKSTQATNGEPDLFIFGAPAAFRGYYWGWSKELLRARMGASVEQRNLWSWVLLKAYTRNQGGVVRLRSDSPRSQPDINFHSFDEGCTLQEAASDMQALAEGVTFVRELNAKVTVFGNEIQPGAAVSEDQLPRWIGNEAWGHHACGTCRMGSDPWQANTGTLEDTGAVLDSQFRVHGVRGLRVVDTSVFPRIPGYFIVTPTFMVGEKAADTLLADSAIYPRKLEAAEACAIRARRRRTKLPESVAAADSEVTQRLPSDTIGLALSGGGVRSATFCLGVLQAFARKGFLRHIDMLSSVSGGGYIAAFLGRLYTRMTQAIANPGQRVEATLSDISSSEVWWLRTHARYLTGSGRTDLVNNGGTVWRNLLSVHVTVALLILAVELLLVGVGNWCDPPRPTVVLPYLGAMSLTWTPWWWTPLLVLVLGVVPVWFGFWLAPKPGTTAAISIGALPVWLLALFGSAVLLARPHLFPAAVLGLFILLLSWVWQEAALWGMRTATNLSTRGVIARNRLTSAAGITLGLFLVTMLWVVFDTLADYCASHAPEISSSIMGLLAASLPGLRELATRLAQRAGGKSKTEAGPGQGQVAKDKKSESLLQTVVLGVIAFVLVGFLLFALDVIAHWAFGRPARGWWLLLATTAFSLVIGRATGFVNLSSLGSLYAARLARTYLGATNLERARPAADSDARNVDAAHPEDDTFLYDYHPEAHGGPLHLINVCVNETVDVTSGRQLAEDKGLSMCLGPEGVSVGVRYHALWDPVPSPELTIWQRMLRGLEHPDNNTESATRKTGLTALPLGPDPEAFHVLAKRRVPTVAVESLRLSEWTAISGAAVSTGLGRKSTLPLSLLTGLFNVRLGYWWNSGISSGDRPGNYPPSVWRRIKSLPGYLFRTQSTILDEWRGYFAGPSKKLWYLTDGGHSENTGLYELIRRRLPFMISVDSEADPGYSFDDMGLLVRRVRLDFGARVEWIDPTEARRNGVTGWEAFEQAGGGDIPAWVRQWVNADGLGNLGGILRRGRFAAAVARVTYDGVETVSWLVVIKASLASPPEIPLDVECYAKGSDGFPNESTVDQVFDDDQWESYRVLGERVAGAVGGGA